MYGKQCRPWSYAVFCSIWSVSILLAKAYLSQYLGLLQYQYLKKYQYVIHLSFTEFIFNFAFRFKLDSFSADYNLQLSW